MPARVERPGQPSSAECSPLAWPSRPPGTTITKSGRACPKPALPLCGPFTQVRAGRSVPSRLRRRAHERAAMKRTPSHRVTKHAAVFLIALAYLFFPRETRSSASPADQARPPFQWLRYDEDYSFLADPARRTEFWDAVKYIPIAGARAGFLSFGVDARER